MLQCVVVGYLNFKFISHNFKVKIHKYFENFFCTQRRLRGKFVLGRVCRITEELRHDNKKDLVSAYSNFTHWYPHIYPQLGRFSTRGVSNVEKQNTDEILLKSC